MAFNYDNLIPIDRINILKKETKKLSTTVLVPSASHGYALAVEYIQKWFLSKFDKDFFKTVYIEGKHIFDESRRFNIDNTARRQNPSVAIIPSIDFSFDQDKIDLPLGGLYLPEKRSTTETCFFRDYENGLFIKEYDQLNLLNFTIKVYVDTRATQLNLWHFMKLAFRVGLSQGEYVDMDFSLPEDLMLQLAIDTGFEVCMDNKKIKNVSDFLAYLNKHSSVPFLYKLRCENGRDEFFIRITAEYVHIAIPDYLSVDDGDRVGHTYENFPIEMNLSLRFPSPQTFLYMTRQPQTILEGIVMENNKDIVGLYSIKYLDIPPVNEKGWNLYIETEWLEDNKTNKLKIDFSSLFNIPVREVLDYTKKQFLSPYIFINIKLFNPEGDLIPFKIDWDTLELESTDESKLYHKVVIAIYLDNSYINETLTIINNSTDNRLNSTIIER